METLIASLIGAAITFLFVRRYLKQLTAKSRGGAKSAAAAAAAPVSTHPCPRCAKSIPQGSAFCSHCGAALAMWSVHRATVQAAGSSPQGKPRPVINASLCVGCGSCVHACPEQGTLELTAGKAILAHADRCVGHAKCVEVCPTQAISLSVGGVLQTVRVPMVKDNFETNIAGIFIVGELGGMGLIKTAINEGKLAIDHVRQRIACSSTADQSAGADIFDVAIVGSGPAGLSASLAAQQAGLRYITLEQGEIASTIRQYPRQKFLMAEPVDIPLYGSLYVADGTKEALLSVWETILANTGVQIRTNEGVERIRKNGAGFYVETPKQEYRARHIVLAMGRRGKPRRLNVPGENLSKVAYRLIEAETYHQNDLLVVGGGDSAIEASLALSRSGNNRVTLSYRGGNFDRARQRNREMLESAEKEGRVEILRSSNVVEVTEESVTLDCSGQRRQLANHYTFVMIGGESPEDFLRRTGIEIVEKALTL